MVIGLTTLLAAPLPDARANLHQHQIWVNPAAAALSLQPSPEGSEQRAPFDDFAYRGDRLGVRIQGRWYELDGLSGDGWSLTWDQLRAASENAFRRQWQRRIAEDLDAALAAAGVVAGDTLTVLARPIDGPAGQPVGEAVTLAAIPHTHANRIAALESRIAEATRQRVERLWTVQHDPRPALESLADALRTRHAQGSRLGIDWDEAVAAELARLGPAATGAEIIRAAQRLVARAGDGHSGVHEFADAVRGGYLPFTLLWVDGAWRGYSPATMTWIWPADATDVRIDGVPIDEWIATVEPFIPAGSSQYVRRNAARLAQRVELVRELLGLDKAPGAPVEVTWAVANARAAETSGATPRSEPERMSFRADLATQRSTARIAGPVPHDPETGVGFGWLDAPGGLHVACLRIASMEHGAAFRAAVHDAMRRALDADALVIDVRGNTGGSREAVEIVLPYLMQEEAFVYNLARPLLSAFDADKLAAGEDELLANRFLRPVLWSGWTNAERAAIETVMEGFTPSWAPRAGWEGAGFGPWYAAVVSRERHAPDEPAVRSRLPFRGPVVVLLDDACFSATDIFLGAVERLPTVTLVGVPSGGGSARSHTIRIDGPPPFAVRLATIASFRPDGRAYDGVGIAPDIEVAPAPEDYEGKGDRVLDAALRLLASRPGAGR